MGKRRFNEKLSEICDIVYSKAPKFKNELVNVMRVLQINNQLRIIIIILIIIDQHNQRIK